MSEAEKNQELHRLAALAAGYELKWVPEWPGGGCLMRRVVPEPPEPFSKWVPWQPLEDNDDSFRLEVDLELEIYHGDDDGDPAVFVGYPSANGRIAYAMELSRKDKMAATRLAILRAAAEIGKKMPNSEPAGVVAPVIAAAPQPDESADAARYRWLRAQHWDTGLLAVVADPKKAVKLGHDCPYGERLDEAIDAAMMAEKIVGTVNERKGAL